MDLEKMSTKEFVDKIKDDQRKDEKNKEHQGYGHPEKRLPSKQGIQVANLWSFDPDKDAILMVEPGAANAVPGSSILHFKNV